MAKAIRRTHNAEVRDPAETNDQDPQPSPAAEEQDTSVNYPVSVATTAKVPETGLPQAEWRKQFDFPGVLAAVPECSEQVMEFVSRYCADESGQIDIFVAVQEALANAALHGCHDDPLRRIHCEVTANADDIIIVVRDPGPGFNLELADPGNFRASKLTHGRGICLMRSLMSEVSFAHHGAEVVLRRRLNSGR